MGRSKSWLYMRLDDLVANHGFPAAARGQGSHRDQAAVAAWLQGLDPPAEQDPPPDDVHAWRDLLDRRAVALSAQDPRENPNV